MQQVRRWIVRVLSEECLLFAPLEALFEEFGGGYNGFERWRKDAYREVSLENLLSIQRDLRLWLRWPDGHFAFADLIELSEDSSRFAQVPTDPFEVLCGERSKEQEVWEYFPYSGESICRTVHEDVVETWSSLWQERLFGG